MITTTDNPYDPFTQFDESYAYDVSMGYHTLAYSARIAVSSEELSEFDDDKAIEDAIDEIIKYNILGIYRKVAKE